MTWALSLGKAPFSAAVDQRPTPPERHYTCAIIARVGADGVRAVSVRRDPRV